MASAFGQSKSEGKKPLEMISPGGSSGGNGPTGSSRSYPKGGSGPANTKNAPFNPQKVPVTDRLIGGV